MLAGNVYVNKRNPIGMALGESESYNSVYIYDRGVYLYVKYVVTGLDELCLEQNSLVRSHQEAGQPLEGVGCLLPM